MAITCVSIIMTVIVLSFFYRGPTLTHVNVIPLGKTSVMTIEGERGFLGGGFVNFINSK